MFRKQSGYLAEDLDWCAAKSRWIAWLIVKKIREKSVGNNLNL